MILSMANQGLTFLLTVAFGFALGVCYDALRIFRFFVRHNGFFVALEDIVFWIGAALALFFLLLGRNFGEVRAFMFLGAALGVLLHFLLLSPLIMKFAGRLKKGLKTFGRYVKMKFAKEGGAENAE